MGEWSVKNPEKMPPSFMDGGSLCFFTNASLMTYFLFIYLRKEKKDSITMNSEIFWPQSEGLSNVWCVCSHLIRPDEYYTVKAVQKLPLYY